MFENFDVVSGATGAVAAFAVIAVVGVVHSKWQSIKSLASAAHAAEKAALTAVTDLEGKVGTMATNVTKIFRETHDDFGAAIALIREEGGSAITRIEALETAIFGKVQTPAPVTTAAQAGVQAVAQALDTSAKS